MHSSRPPALDHLSRRSTPDVIREGQCSAPACAWQERRSANDNTWQRARRAIAAPATIRLFGIDVMTAEPGPALDWLCARLEAGVSTRVAFLNAHCVNMAACDVQYRRALTTADVVLPDGSGLAMAARLHNSRPRNPRMDGHRLVNLNGTDLVPALSRRLARSGHSVFLLGGRPGVAAAAAARLQQDCPGLLIAGVRDGYFGADQDASVVAGINASGAAVVLVAMGVPMQDKWLARLQEQLSAPLLLGVGGLFDFLSGRIPRAPAALRRVGMEWTWRLYQEPARMWQRYIVGNPVFLARAVAAALQERAALRERAMPAGLDAMGKRLLDLAGAGAALLLAAPLLLLCMGLIRLTSRGPALLRQTRIGEDGVPFTMLKLRSMYIDAAARQAALLHANEHGAGGLTFKLQRDPRITPFGRLLRRSSIDELPQLWNVLMGDMSLVGPRPQLPHEVRRYAPGHYTRLAGKPGLTCLWQISGRAELAFDRQFELDVRYLQTRSLLADLGILLRTIPAVLQARGAY
ncbi:MAG: WecB/TagA/CpsF family glycosyltransferase [Janthinobacterium lividum]